MNHQIFERKLLLELLQSEHTWFRLVLQNKNAYKNEHGRCNNQMLDRLKIELCLGHVQTRAGTEVIFCYQRVRKEFSQKVFAFFLLIPRAELRREDPPNLSILLSGGKETNHDSLSNGE